MSYYADVNAWLIAAVRASSVTDFGTSEFATLVIPQLERKATHELTEGALSILRHIWGKAHGRRFSASYLAATADFDVRAAKPVAPRIPDGYLEALAASVPGPDRYAEVARRFDAMAAANRAAEARQS